MQTLQLNVFKVFLFAPLPLSYMIVNKDTYTHVVEYTEKYCCERKLLLVEELQLQIQTGTKIVFFDTVVLYINVTGNQNYPEFKIKCFFFLLEIQQVFFDLYQYTSDTLVVNESKISLCNPGKFSRLRPQSI